MLSHVREYFGVKSGPAKCTANGEPTTCPGNGAERWEKHVYNRTIVERIELLDFLEFN